MYERPNHLGSNPTKKQLHDALQDQIKFICLQMKELGWTRKAVLQGRRALEVQLYQPDKTEFCFFSDKTPSNQHYIKAEVQRLRQKRAIYCFRKEVEADGDVDNEPFSYMVYEMEAKIGGLVAIRISRGYAMPANIMDALVERGQSKLLDWIEDPSAYAISLGDLFKGGGKGAGDRRPTKVHRVDGEKCKPGEIIWDPRTGLENGYEFDGHLGFGYSNRFTRAMCAYIRRGGFNPAQEKAAAEAEDTLRQTRETVKNITTEFINEALPEIARKAVREVMEETRPELIEIAKDAAKETTEVIEKQVVEVMATFRAEIQKEGNSRRQGHGDDLEDRDETETL